MSTALLLIVATGVTGCGSEPRTAEPDAYVGTWRLAVEAVSGCWPAFTLGFTVEQDDADAANAERLNVIADWWLASDPTTRRLLTGNIDWSANTFAFLVHDDSDVVTPTGGDFSGTGASPEKLTGTFTDPNGSFSGKVGCAAGATATHVSTAVE